MQAVNADLQQRNLTSLHVFATACDSKGATDSYTWTGHGDAHDWRSACKRGKVEGVGNRSSFSRKPEKCLV